MRGAVMVGFLDGPCYARAPGRSFRRPAPSNHRIMRRHIVRRRRVELHELVALELSGRLGVDVVAVTGELGGGFGGGMGEPGALRALAAVRTACWRTRL